MQLTEQMQVVDDSARVAAFQVMLDDMVKVAYEERKQNPLDTMTYSLDMSSRVLTCTLGQQQAKLSLASLDPYLFQALTVGEIIAAARAKFADQIPTEYMTPAV